ncbi:MAG: YqgE/AlgH family protein [Chitinophagia bacterium]|jgi:putative transcriptional regulator
MQATPSPIPGSLLISDPFLQDPNFSRSVVLICEHESTGSFGLVLNQPMHLTLGDLIPAAADIQVPVFCGGPVGNDTLHFIHKRTDLLDDTIVLKDGIGWSGNIYEIIKHLKSGEMTEKDIVFFVGYSGWGEGQLMQELDAKTWIRSEVTLPLLFQINPENKWQSALLQMGGEYANMANYPIDPQLN